MLHVVTPPEPIVAPEEILGVTVGDEAVVGLIAAVTEEIDGPTGWLGRSLGPQTLEWSAACWPCNWFTLPCKPIIDISGVNYLDISGMVQTVDAANWSRSGDQIVFRNGWSTPSLAGDPNAVRIQYQAGYDGDTTGAIPERARQAIILSVQHLRSLQVESLYLKVDEVDGIGRKEFTLSDQASNIVERTCDRLLSTLRVFS